MKKIWDIRYKLSVFKESFYGKSISYTVRRLLDTCVIYITHLFPMHAFSTPWKHPAIRQWLFEERKQVYIRFPFATANEKFTKLFINKLLLFTNSKVKFNVTNFKVKFSVASNTGKIHSHVSHYSCVIYRGVCSCVAGYLRETVCNKKIRCNEHNEGVDKNFECAKHLNEY